MSCKHESFSAGVNVTRLTGQRREVAVFNADVSIRCNIGQSAAATTIVDRTELHVPIRPPSQAVFD